MRVPGERREEGAGQKHRKNFQDVDDLDREREQSDLMVRDVEEIQDQNVLAVVERQKGQRTEDRETLPQQAAQIGPVRSKSERPDRPLNQERPDENADD